MPNASDVRGIARSRSLLGSGGGGLLSPGPRGLPVIPSGTVDLYDSLPRSTGSSRNQSPRSEGARADRLFSSYDRGQVAPTHLSVETPSSPPANNASLRSSNSHSSIGGGSGGGSGGPLTSRGGRSTRLGVDQGRVHPVGSSDSGWASNRSAGSTTGVAETGETGETGETRESEDGANGGDDDDGNGSGSGSSIPISPDSAADWAPGMFGHAFSPRSRLRRRPRSGSNPMMVDGHNPGESIPEFGNSFEALLGRVVVVHFFFGGGCGWVAIVVAWCC